MLTRQREGFYWLTILVTFALGTAAGDLVAEQLGVGYLNSRLSLTRGASTNRQKAGKTPRPRVPAGVR
jgi:uncharacterized membrane-anchored protein